MRYPTRKARQLVHRYGTDLKLVRVTSDHLKRLLKPPEPQCEALNNADKRRDV